MKTESAMDFGAGEGIRDAVEAWIGKLVAIAGGLWAIWKGAKFAVVRARVVWKTLTAFADSVQALQLINQQIETIRIERAIQTELSRTPFWKADQNGNCIEANSAYLKLLNLTMEEIRGAGWEAAIHPDDMGFVIQAWESAVRERTQFRLAFRLRSQTETIRVESKAFPIALAGRFEFYGSTEVLSRKPITVE